MNEFTKDELQNIYWHFEYYLECLEPKFGKCKSELRKDLMNKIQSMIDNYCEHNCERVADCLDCGVSEYKCNKCAYVTYEGLE